MNPVLKYRGGKSREIPRFYNISPMTSIATLSLFWVAVQYIFTLSLKMQL